MSAGFVSFDGFEIQPAADRIVYRYGLDDREAFETAVGVDLSGLVGNPEGIARLEPAAFALGMGLLTYVYVAFCPPEVRVRAAKLSPEAIGFWTELYESGHIEHFYVHRRPFTGIRVICESDRAIPPSPVAPAGTPRVLCPLGCGKDSTLLFELLRDSGVSPRWVYFEEYPGELDASWRYRELARISGAPDVAVVSHLRGFADALRLRNPKDDIENYVLYPCLYAFASLLIALRDGYDHIAVGNERSANLGNFEYEGRTVNHQYEKSQPFERALAAYILRELAPGVTYFSGLMPLWELEIVRRFSEKSAYLQIFMSCNQPDGSRWCARCPKCAMTAALLAAFLDPPRVWAIFGDDLLQEPRLLEIFEELLGLRGVKPLECVCAPEELKAALFLARRRYPQDRMPLVMLRFSKVIDEGERYLGLLSERGDADLPAWFRPGF